MNSLQVQLEHQPTTLRQGTTAVGMSALTLTGLNGHGMRLRANEGSISSDLLQVNSPNLMHDTVETRPEGGSA